MSENENRLAWVGSVKQYSLAAQTEGERLMKIGRQKMRSKRCIQRNDQRLNAPRQDRDRKLLRSCATRQTDHEATPAHRTGVLKPGREKATVFAKNHAAEADSAPRGTAGCAEKMTPETAIRNSNSREIFSRRRVL
jgi:hypothetical protein